VNLNRFIFASLVIWLTAGCSKTEPPKTLIARLDNQTLDLEEIRAHVDTSREPSLAQVQQYVQRWLTEETLYREAIERGLDQSDDLNRRVEDIKRQLTINALLEKEIYSPQMSNFSQQETHQYYDTHISEFNLIHDAALISYVQFKNRDAATEFRNAVVKGTSWRSAVEQRGASIIMRLDSSFQTQLTLLPAELWRVASSASSGEVSFPISASGGYYILNLWKYYKQGQTADISFVEQEIRGRMTVEKRRKLYNQLIQKLRAKHSIEVFVDSTSVSGTMKAE
jgi:hypothetical protein